MRVTAPWRHREGRGRRAVGATVATLALLGAGLLWLALNAVVAWVTRD